MSNYNSLKATIDANIKQNGNQEITGQILNSVLNQMVTTLGAGYQFAGVATINTNPGSPDAKVFYIANGKGTYEKFGGINVTEDDVVVLYWDSSWHKVSTGIASYSSMKITARNDISLTSIQNVPSRATATLVEDTWKLSNISALGNSLYMSFAKGSPIIPEGHIFYFREKVKTDGDLFFNVYTDNSHVETAYYQKSGDWEVLSNIYTIEFNKATSLMVAFAFTSTGVTFADLKDFMMLDLTATFGAGKEPSKEYMDNLFASRVESFYGEKVLFSMTDGNDVKALNDKINDLVVGLKLNSSNNVFNADSLADKSAFVGQFNTILKTYIEDFNRSNDVCVEYLTASDSWDEIIRKINYSMRKEILFVGMSNDAMARAINKRLTERILRFSDARPLTDTNRNASISTGIQGDEPSVIVSEDGGTMYLYAHLKRWSSNNGVNWNNETPLVLSDGGYIMHANVNLIDGVYWLFGCRNTTGGDLLLYTSTDGINFTYRGIAIKGGHSVGTYAVANWGNSFLIKDNATGWWYLYFEFESNTIHWAIAVAKSSNPASIQTDGTIGGWINAKEDLLFKPSMLSATPNNAIFGSGNPDIVRGSDNMPIKCDGKYYMYYHGTCYQTGTHFNQSNIMRAYSYDLINWTSEGVIFDNRDIPTAGDNSSGNADQCVIEFKGKSYLFYSWNINNAQVQPTIKTLIDSRGFYEILKLNP